MSAPAKNSALVQLGVVVAAEMHAFIVGLPHLRALSIGHLPLTIKHATHLPPPTCCLPLATCHLPFAVGHLLFATCHLSLAIAHSLLATGLFAITLSTLHSPLAICT
eukprot:5818724-Alexandrium_andersonii.AAC.1